MTEALHRSTINSPVGKLTVISSSEGLRAVLWETDTADRVRLGETIEATDQFIDQASDELGEYFAGKRRRFEVPLDPAGTPFQLRAWEALRTIRYGCTVSYREQAQQLGNANLARAVGGANRRNPLSIIVPCHRVIGHSGRLTGFAGGLDTKAFLLDLEQQHRN